MLRTRGWIVLAGLLVAAACVPDAALEPSLKYGPPGGGGGGGGGGNGGGGGGGTGDLYSELVFLYRAVDGRPIMAEFGAEVCTRLVSYTMIPDLDPVPNPVNGADVWLIPLVGDGLAAAAPGTAAEDGELAPCDVDPAYADFVKEVAMGRLNMGRSPLKVLDKSLLEVLRKLRTASVVLLDHAGRLSPDDIPIDAPGENYAIHVSLQTKGTISGPLGTFTVPPQPGSQHAFLDHAASGLAGAADKTGNVNADLVAYSNRIMGIPATTTVMGVLVSARVDGVLLGVPGEKYLNYAGYSYSRAATFPGCATGFLVVGTTTVPFAGTLMDLVFGGQNLAAGNINGFAQRADDALAVIVFAHDNIVTAIDRIGESTVCGSF